MSRLLLPVCVENVCGKTRIEVPTCDYIIVADSIGISTVVTDLRYDTELTEKKKKKKINERRSRVCTESAAAGGWLNAAP